MFAIYKKELRSYFINPIGYVYVGVFLALAALVCCYTTLISGSYDTSSYFVYMMFAFIILIPILTMRLFAEERKLRTEQLLLTAPVTLTGMVLGKFFAALTLFASTLLVSCINFIPIYVVASVERGNQDYDFYHIGPVTGQLVGCLVSLLLIGAAFIAIGTFISALTENQLAAAVVTIAVIAGMVGIGVLNNYIDVYWLRTVLSWISVYSRFGNFANGLFDFAAILYYASLSFVFLFLTVRVYEKRRWG
jgi:ABC-2 type transport system permease protein